MATASVLSGETFQCAICLDVFIEPVTTPCGHNYCCICINQYWDSRGSYQCPLCKRAFFRRPELHVNTVVSGLAVQYKKSIEGNASAPASHLPETTVPCDICSVIKVEAAKSCLMCLTSLCEAHLEPHRRVSVLRSHTLVDPMWSLDERMCKKHNKLKEMYCRTEKICICVLCLKTNHKGHNVVALEEAYEVAVAKKDEIMAKIQRLLNVRSKKICEMERSVVISQREANREKAASVEVFTNLICSIQKNQAELMEVIDERHQVTTQRADGFIHELRVEMFDLEYKRATVEQLLQSKDHYLLLQSLLTLFSPLKNWMSVTVGSALCIESVRDAAALVKQTVDREMELLPEMKLRRMREFTVDLTLDPDTAHCSLTVSEDGKQVTHKNLHNNNPKRSEAHPDVLAKEGFTTGRSYFEVQVKGNTKWVVGVVRESVDRKGNLRLSVTNGFWTIGLDEGAYKAYGMSNIKITLKDRPQTVGIFVDYDKGLVSFYDVDSKSCIYSFRGHSFKEKLYPYFCPQGNKEGTNTAPLIIANVTPAR